MEIRSLHNKAKQTKPGGLSVGSGMPEVLWFLPLSWILKAVIRYRYLGVSLNRKSKILRSKPLNLKWHNGSDNPVALTTSLISHTICPSCPVSQGI